MTRKICQTSAVFLAVRGRPTLKVLPALLLSCFVAQPLFAQTATAPVRAEPARTPAPATPAKAAPAANPAAADGARTGKANTTGGAPEPQAGASDEMATVEVVASRPTNKVDRDVYDLKNDISVSNASAADVLNNVPAVTVDPDGNVSLRGSQNVQIMVNGKRDAQFQGANRGDALNSFPAENIESIEVINVPGAEFGNEGGSGPIINLVLKRNRKPGSRATVGANHGTEERYNANLIGEHAEGPYSISGNIGVRKNGRTTHSETQRQDLDPATGNGIGGYNSVNDRLNTQQGISAASTFTYNVGERDQAGATASYSKSKTGTDGTSSTLRFGPDLSPTADFTNRSTRHSPAENFGLGVSYDHRSGEPGEFLKLDVRYTGQKNDSDQDVLYDYRLLPTHPWANNFRETDSRNRILDVSLDYQRVLWETWTFTGGTKYAESKASNATNYLAVNAATGAYEPVPSRISDFESDDRNLALYGTLSTKFFDDLAVKAGIRGEYTQLDVHQPLLDQEDKYTYMNWLPSFYANYGIGENGQLGFKASRRIARPNERDLNPNLVYYSDFSARQGNPNLQPVNNDNYELTYGDKFFNVDSRIALFKRRQSPLIGNRSYPLASDPNVLVTSPINFGANDSTGVELNFNVRKLFLQGLSANLNSTISNVKQMRLFNFNNSVPVELSNRQKNIKLRLAYQVAAESFQLLVNHTGESLSGQGVNKPNTMTNFSWQHRLSPRMTLNLNVNNVFGTGKFESYTENEVLRMHSLSINQSRIVMLGLRYQWGGVTGDERIRNGGMRQGGMFRGNPDGGDSGGGRNGGFGGGGFGGGGGGGRGF